MSNARFSAPRGRCKGGVITCWVCGKRTRETGHDESGLLMCRVRIIIAEAINEESDYGLTRAQWWALCIDRGVTPAEKAARGYTAPQGV